MKKATLLFLIIFIGCFQNASASNGYAMVQDTIKNPEERKLNRKEQKAMAKAGKSGDFTLSAEKRKADKLYTNLAYMESVDLYADLESSEQNRFVMNKLANSYRLNGETEDAEYWYSKIVKDTKNPEVLLRYAQVLQSNDKCEDAVRWYKEYLVKSLDTNRTFILDCDELEDIPSNPNVEVGNMSDLNTDDLDFSPIQYKDGVVFTSNRGTNALSKNVDKWTKNNFSDLFFAKIDESGNIGEAVPLDGDINGKLHDGAATFNKNGSLMIFTRNNRKGKNQEGNKLLKLYQATGDNGYWDDAEDIGINSDEFSTCHPTLSRDGRRLYFASDRPGGFGGMDIYVSERVGKKWQEPKNLGDIVNTGGNEVFPFLSDEEILYFSSDGHRGLGGLDIFAVRQEKAKDEGSWKIRENLGSPFNSLKDDFAFTINNNDETGYLSSNRTGGQGQDDIYQWKKTGDTNLLPKNGKIKKRICVYDEVTGTKLPDVEVTIVETAGRGAVIEGKRDLFLTLKPLEADNKEYVLSVIQEEGSMVDKSNDYVTNERGSFRYEIKPERDYILMIEKNGFDPVRQKISTNEFNLDDEYCVPLKRRECIALNGLVKNKNYNSFIPNAQIFLFNKCTGETIETSSDANGFFDYCLSCDCEYEIRARKINFSEGKAEISTIGMICTGAADADLSLEPIDALVELALGDNPYIGSPRTNPDGTPLPYDYSTPSWTDNPSGNYPSPIYGIPGTNGAYPNPNGGITPEMLNRYFNGTDTPSYRPGQVIKLSNIYYDFDKYYIRSDAQTELNYVVDLLKAYPSLELSMQSHTDARGTKKYNQWLSKKRAESAMNYLVDQGISRARLIKMGFGEVQLVNGCEDGIDCDEDEHQLNRRTEIKVTAFNEPNVLIQD